MVDWLLVSAYLCWAGLLYFCLLGALVSTLAVGMGDDSIAQALAVCMSQEWLAAGMRACLGVRRCMLRMGWCWCRLCMISWKLIQQFVCFSALERSGRLCGGLFAMLVVEAAWNGVPSSAMFAQLNLYHMQTIGWPDRKGAGILRGCRSVASSS